MNPRTSLYEGPESFTYGLDPAWAIATQEQNSHTTKKRHISTPRNTSNMTPVVKIPIKNTRASNQDSLSLPETSNPIAIDLRKTS